MPQSRQRPRSSSHETIGMLSQRADGGAAAGAAGPRLDDRLAAREPVGEHVHEASERRAADAEQDQLAGGRLHRYQVPPALQPPVLCGAQVRSIVPVGSRWTLNVTGSVEVDDVSHLELVAGGGHDRRGPLASCSEVCCSSRSAVVTPA